MAIRQLLLSKYVFEKGQTMFDHNNPLSRGLATTLFQDSIEILIWAFVKKYQISTYENIQFSELVASIISAEKNIKLPLQAEIMEITKASINFKQKGNLPGHSEALKFQADTEEVLRKFMKAFFEVEFDDLALDDFSNDAQIIDRTT